MTDNQLMRTTEQIRNQRVKKPRLSLLATIELLVAFGAIFGAIGLMTGYLEMSDETLFKLPFQSWVAPGVFLLLIVGIPMLVASVSVLVRSKWWEKLSLTAGELLMAWIVVQVLAIREFSWLQPTFFLVGAVIVGLAYREEGNEFEREMARAA